jgi:hypothetical protein
MSQPTGTLSFADIAADDALLDRLGDRLGPLSPSGSDSSSGPGSPAEQVHRLLAALVRDVDHGLPTGIDPVATELLTARLAGRPGRVARPGRAAPPVPVTPGPPTAPSTGARSHRRSPDYVAAHRASRADGARRQAVTLSRGGAVVASMAALVASAGVSAAVTGDPAGAFGLRTLSSMVSADRWVGSAQAHWLGRRIDLAAQRPGGPDDREVAELRAEAARLPDPQAGRLQRRLDSLTSRISAAGPEPAGPIPSPTAQPTQVDPTGAGQQPSQVTATDPGAESSTSQPGDGGPVGSPTEPRPTEPRPTRPRPTKPTPTKPTPTKPTPTKPTPTKPTPTKPGPTKPKPPPTRSIKPEVIPSGPSTSAPTPSGRLTTSTDIVRRSGDHLDRPVVTGPPSRPWLR